MNNKNILLICYTFPPNEGIGGRRWVKFSKELYKRGYTVFVICAERFTEKESLWSKSLMSGINLITLPSKYPAYLYYPPKNIFQKIKYRYYLMKHKIVTQGNYYDRAVSWEKQIIRKAALIIKENSIKNVIVSGAPFHLFKHTIKLKEIFPAVKFVADYRDPWTNNRNSFGLNSISEKRIKCEIESEREILKKYDAILVVAEQMKEYLISLDANVENKIYTLENGFDYDDFSAIKLNHKTQQVKIRFLFAGNLYRKVEYLFIPFLKAICKIRTDNPDYFNLLDINFFGGFPEEYKILVSEYKLNDAVKTHGEVPLARIYQEISYADVCMLFLNKEFSFSLSTKFCEYISQKKNILVFSNGGHTADFIVKNKIGYAAQPDTIFEQLQKIISDFENKNLCFNPHFDISKYSLQSLTNRLEVILSNL
jgi:hypothetical protein